MQVGCKSLYVKQLLTTGAVNYTLNGVVIKKDTLPLHSKEVNKQLRTSVVTCDGPIVASVDSRD